MANEGNQELWVRYPLLDTIWKTRASRFNAAARLERRHWWKNLALALLSAYVLALSVLPKFITAKQQELPIDYLGFAPLVASALILVFSIIVAFDTDSIRSKYLHDNAKRLSDIYHHYKIEMIDPSEPKHDITRKTLKLCEKAMRRCPYNHDDIDYKRAMSEALPRKFWYRRWLDAVGFCDVYLWPLAAIAIPPMIAAPAVASLLS